MIKNGPSEDVFFSVLEDLREHLGDLTLVGGWLPFVYSRFLWRRRRLHPAHTMDFDFGVGAAKADAKSNTIFESLSKLNYTERHPEMDKRYPVIFYKDGKYRIDFIASTLAEDRSIDIIVGRQVDVSRVERFDMLLSHQIKIEVRHKRRRFMVNCPTPSAFVLHKAVTCHDRTDELKLAKDLFYIYFVLRYAPKADELMDEIAHYERQRDSSRISKQFFALFENQQVLDA